MSFAKLLMGLMLLSYCSAAEYFAPDIEQRTFIYYIENQAMPGDTIYFPADTAVWNQPYTIQKGVSLIGADMDRTCIISNFYSEEPLIIYNPANYDLNTPFRFSRFTLDCGGKSRGIYLGHENIFLPFKIQTKVRVDHCRFKNPRPGIPGQYIWHFNMYGVVDSNIFEASFFPLRAYPNADCSWWQYETYTPGAKDDNMYFEDNIFKDISGMISDCAFAGRFVYRYNDITFTVDSWPLFDLHGNQANTFGMCASFGGEIYGNNIIGNHAVRLLDHRGGQAFVFCNNKISTNDYYEIQVREEYADPSNPPSAAPDGQPQHVSDSYYWNNRMNGNGRLFTIAEGQHVGDIPLANRDYYYDPAVDGKLFDGTKGVGYGPLSKRPVQCTPGVGYWATDQNMADLTGKIGAHPDSVLRGVFYKATAPNKWTEYYRPLPYPHPLREPEPPQNLHFIK